MKNEKVKLHQLSVSFACLLKNSFMVSCFVLLTLSQLQILQWMNVFLNFRPRKGGMRGDTFSFFPVGGWNLRPSSSSSSSRRMKGQMNADSSLCEQGRIWGNLSSVLETCPFEEGRTFGPRFKWEREREREREWERVNLGICAIIAMFIAMFELSNSRRSRLEPGQGAAMKLNWVKWQREKERNGKRERERESNESELAMAHIKIDHW